MTPEGKLCSEFGKQFQALTGRIGEAEEAIERFISSGKPSDIEKARELFSSLEKAREKMMREYREKAIEILQEWHEDVVTSAIKENVEDKIEFDKDGRVVFVEDLSIPNLGYAYLPCLIKKVKGDFTTGRSPTKIDYLEEVEGNFTSCCWADSFSAKRLKRVSGEFGSFASLDVNLPSLEWIGRGINIPGAPSVKAESLKKVEGDLYLHQVTSAEFPQLEEVKKCIFIEGTANDFDFRKAFPKLKRVGKAIYYTFRTTAVTLTFYVSYEEIKQQILDLIEKGEITDLDDKDTC
jgi:hypothetical protein